MNEFGYRMFRALGFGLCTMTGLMLFHAPTVTIVAAAMPVAFLFLLNILTYWAGTFAALTLIFGSMAFASGVTFGSSSIAALEDRATNLIGRVDLGAPSPSPRGVGESLAEKLSKLKEACDKGLMSKDECDAAKTKIVADFTK